MRTAAAAVAGGVCLLLPACSAGGDSSARGAAPGGTAAGAARAAAPAAAGSGAAHAGPGAAALAKLAPAGGQSVIRRASLTLRTSDPRAAAGRASQLATGAGGYVSAENTTMGNGHPALVTVTITVKVPAAAYQQVLSKLARLGRPVTQAQQAQDVTQAVADVSSRVRSAQAAITQLRALLARAGSVNSLLSVQDQINTEEAGLEALQAQARALAGQTAYATVSLLLVTPAPAAHHRAAAHGGFPGGLAAGWRGLRAAVSWLLTGVGAALPFILPLAVLALGWYAARRWLSRRGAGAGTTG
jgi:uncharacterized protein DUF4349